MSEEPWGTPAEAMPPLQSQSSRAGGNDQFFRQLREGEMTRTGGALGKALRGPSPNCASVPLAPLPYIGTPQLRNTGVRKS